MDTDSKYAICYRRESEEDRNNKTDGITTSITNQQKYAEQAAKEPPEHHIKYYYDDINIHSTDTNRKGINALLLHIKTNHQKISKLYIKDYTRLGRGNAFFDLRDKIQHAGLTKEQIYFYQEPHDNNKNNTEDDSIIMIKIGAHTILIEKNRKETKQLHQKKQTEGLPYIPAPYGYKYHKGQWKINQKQAQIIQEVHKDQQNQKNYQQTTTRLNITKDQYYRITKHIKNGTYTKSIITHKKHVKDSKGQIIKTETITYKGNHEPIIHEGVPEQTNGHGSRPCDQASTGVQIPSPSNQPEEKL